MGNGQHTPIVNSSLIRGILFKSETKRCLNDSFNHLLHWICECLLVFGLFSICCTRSPFACVSPRLARGLQGRVPLPHIKSKLFLWTLHMDDLTQELHNGTVRPCIPSESTPRGSMWHSVSLAPKWPSYWRTLSWKTWGVWHRVTNLHQRYCRVAKTREETYDSYDVLLLFQPSRNIPVLRSDAAQSMTRRPAWLGLSCWAPGVLVHPRRRPLANHPFLSSMASCRGPVGSFDTAILFFDAPVASNSVWTSFVGPQLIERNLARWDFLKVEQEEVGQSKPFETASLGHSCLVPSHNVLCQITCGLQGQWSSFSRCWGSLVASCTWCGASLFRGLFGGSFGHLGLVKEVMQHAFEVPVEICFVKQLDFNFNQVL